PSLGQNMVAEAADDVRAKSEMAQARLDVLRANKNIDGIPIVASHVEKDGTLLIGIDDTRQSLPGYRDKIQKLVGEDVKIELKTAKVVETSCDSRTSDCEPVTGGIYINTTFEDGTDGTITFAATDDDGNEGFVIAGHSAGFNEGEFVGQPTTEIKGTVITNPDTSTRTCDCAFVKLTGGHEGDEWKIWKTSSSSYNIVSKKLESQLVGNELFRIHATSGTKLGGITGTNWSITNSFGILMTDQYTGVVGDGSSPPTQGGDSGAAVTSRGSTNVDLYGLTWGYITFDPDTDPSYAVLISPWDGISNELNIS
ncbi:MAG TPA: hypothetical protein VF172_05630, partial [Nitrososphaera sp.]